MRQPDLFPEPPPPPPTGPEPGQMRGDLEALAAAAANVEVWCGPGLGWRRFGALIRDRVVVVRQHGRAWSGPSFDLGEASLTPAQEAGEDEPEEAEEAEEPAEA